MQHFSENYWKKRFPAGKRANGPKKRRTGKRANEIECPEKGKGKAPDLKSEARVRKRCGCAASCAGRSLGALSASDGKPQEPGLWKGIFNKRAYGNVDGRVQGRRVTTQSVRGTST